jgi:anti-sigma regulatory factor (Ser/Thr protein kinase)
MTSRLRLADLPNSVAWGRRHAVDVLRARRLCHEDVLETIRLVVSELVSNAVRHPVGDADRPLTYAERLSVGTVELVLEAGGAVVRIAVWDRDPAPPLLRDVDVEATGGRGIFLVARMSARWGHHLCHPGEGKVAWAEVPPPGRETERLTDFAGTGSAQPVQERIASGTIPGPDEARGPREFEG